MESFDYCRPVGDRKPSMQRYRQEMLDDRRTLPSATTVVHELLNHADDRPEVLR